MSLYDAVVSVYSSLGFDALGDKAFRDLVVARVINPTSIRKTPKVLWRLGGKSWSDKTLHRTMSRAQKNDYRSVLAQQCFTHAQATGDITLCLYDVTSLRTHAENESGLRQIGYSKDRSTDPQVVIGLLVDRLGFPLEVECFAGNQAEKNTLIPVLEGFKDRHGIEDLVVAADAGMLSESNLVALDDAGFGFVVGSKNTKAPLDLASHFHWNGDLVDGQIVDTITRRPYTTPQNDPALKAEPVWTPGAYPTSWRAVWTYSFKRAKRDLKVINDQEIRARAVAAGEKATKPLKFVTNSGGNVTVTRPRSRARRRSLG